MSTGKRTAFTQCIEHLGKHSTARNSEHRKPSTVFFNSRSGTTIAEAINLQHISIFGLREDMRNFSQHSQQCIYQQSQQPTDASQRFTCFRQWRSTAGGKDNTGRPSQTTIRSNGSISETVRNRTHVVITFFFFLRMTSQNIDLSSWDILYIVPEYTDLND